MSIQAVAWALEQDLPARPKLALVAIANHASHVDGYAWLRVDTIAKEAACSERAVFNFVGDLIRNGYLRKAIRRGDDGKQRANDYWILFSRTPASWIGDRPRADDEREAESGSDGDAGAQDVVEPHAPGACGKDATEQAAEPVENQQPHAQLVHADRMHLGASGYNAEPSKTKPKENPTTTSRGEGPQGVRWGAVPRGYRPPPPQPVGATVEKNPSLIFVFDGTPAYDAWAKVMGRRHGVSHWHLTTTKVIDGVVRRGWYFPTLFPPSATGPPSHLTEDDLKVLEKMR